MKASVTGLRRPRAKELPDVVPSSGDERPFGSSPAARGLHHRLHRCRATMGRMRSLYHLYGRTLDALAQSYFERKVLDALMLSSRSSFRERVGSLGLTDDEARLALGVLTRLERKAWKEIQRQSEYEKTLPVEERAGKFTEDP